MKNNTFSEITERIKKAKRILLIAHINPDGDTIGSLIALGAYGDALNIENDFFCKTAIPHNLKLFLGNKKILHKVNPAKYDCLISCDCGDNRRIGLECKIDINFDHHINNTVSSVLHYVDAAQSSTGAILYHFLKNSTFKINKHVATALFLAIVTDTGYFRWENTTQEVFNICRDLIAQGASPPEINQMYNEQTTLAQLKMHGQAVNQLRLVHQGKTAYSVVENKKHVDTNGVIDFIRQIKDTEIILLFTVVGKKKVKVSFRSKSGRDIQKIAQSFGGGGHVRAAGAVIEGAVNSVVKVVLSKVKKLYS